MHDREVRDREQIFAAKQCKRSANAVAVSISKTTYIILSRHRLPFLNQLCEEKGIICEQVIFQTRDNKNRR
jgi:hypothetical protein